MAEHFGFFDSKQDSNGNYDREYNGEQFSIPFNALVTNGIVRSAYEQLEVTTSGANMISTIKSGVAFIEGHHYFNDGIIDLTHDVEVLGMDRIDRIVIRKDSNPDARYVKAFIRKGLPSTNPVPPTLTRDENIYEISLAQVRIVGGQGFISTITDERGTVNIGPWAGSDILPSYDDNLLAQHVNNGEIHVTQEQKNSWDQLIFKGGPFLSVNTNFDNLNPNMVFQVGEHSGSVNGPPEHYGVLIYTMPPNTGYGTQEFIAVSTRNRYYRTLADGVWTPWIKVLNQTDYNTLFQSVSNGKSAIANAVTEKGVPTAANAEFATMANNILAINTGKRFASGTVAASGVAPDVNIVVTGLAFTPKLIVAYNADVGRWVVYDGYNVHSYYLSGATAGQVSGKNISTTAFVNAKVEAIMTTSGFDLPVNGTTGTYSWFAIE